MELSYETKNYNSFDLAKFICSILVVIIHVAPFASQEGSTLSNINFGLQNGLCRMAVPLFFIFSGFFLYRKTPLDKFSIEPTKKYIIHISIIYVIWSILYFPLHLMTGSNSFLFDVVIYIRNFLLIGSHAQLWYLNSLIVAVAIVSFLLYKKWTPKRILYSSFVFYIIGLLGDTYFGIISPLLNIPLVGDIIDLYFKLFYTTRNGLFFAFFFVSLGMVLSNVKICFPQKKALFLFLMSLLMMCIESFLIKKFNVAKDYNFLFFSIPSALFCFIFLNSLHFKDSKIYKTLRVLSSLIFYTHIWFRFIISRCTSSLNVNLKIVSVQFILTLALTIIFSLVIMRLSNEKKFHWLRKLY